MNTKNSEKLFKQSKQYFPGGVNSPVRAFRAVGSTPLFIKKGDGYTIWDEDDNSFIDFCASWGPLIHGHNHPKIRQKIQETLQNGTSFGAPTVLENELAELILSNNPYIEQLRFVSSGTEALMSAIRLARGVTKRDKIVKFEGCYHGHSDSMLVNAGSGLVTFGEASSAGVPKAISEQTIVLPLNDIDAVKECFFNYGDQIACVIIEPIPANNGLLLQGQEYLQSLRDICTEYSSLLLFDEVISGFRVGFNGATSYYNISPDIITYGKIIGGGLPVAAYCASREIMQHISPLGSVYQAGTLSGNPLAMAAGIAQLTECLKPNFYKDQENKTQKFVKYINTHADTKGYNFKVISISSIFWFNFDKEQQTVRADQINSQFVSEQFKRLHASLLNKGIYIGPSAYEVGFVSSVHTESVLEYAAKIICLSLDEIF